MEIQSFSNVGEMFESIQAGIDQASSKVTPTQKAITFGSTVARFVPEHSLIVFSKIMTLDELVASERDCGADADEAEMQREHAVIQETRDLFFSRWYSVIEPDGEFGTAHRWSLWPISQELFDAAREAKWYYSDLPSELGQELGDAYHAFRAQMIEQA